MSGRSGSSGNESFAWATPKTPAISGGFWCGLLLFVEEYRQARLQPARTVFLDDAALCDLVERLIDLREIFCRFINFSFGDEFAVGFDGRTDRVFAPAIYDFAARVLAIGLFGG